MTSQNVSPEQQLSNSLATISMLFTILFISILLGLNIILNPLPEGQLSNISLATISKAQQVYAIFHL